MRNIEKYGTKLDLSKNTVPNECLSKNTAPNECLSKETGTK